jgi:uncharacterized SAM-binding protein YcdF (DUF218 family)
MVPKHVVENVKLILNFLNCGVKLEDFPTADVLFLFGNPNEELAQRLAIHAERVYKKKQPKYKKMVVTGGSGEYAKLPNGFDSEASYLVSLLEKEGIYKNALIVEDESKNTLQNVIFGMKACFDAGITPRSVIAMALPPHVRRVLATFSKNFPLIEVCGSSFKIGDEEWQENPERIRRMIEEIDRLSLYAQRGDIAPSVFGHGIISAYREVTSYLKRIEPAR